MRFCALICFVLVLTGCMGRPPAIRIAGSTSVQPVAEILAEGFVKQGGPEVSIQGGGSTAGIQAVLEGVANVGAISRALTPAERKQGLVAHVFAYDVLTLVVHPNNPIGMLTPQQVKAIFAGSILDWSEVGGRPGPIHLITREAGSGSREAFRQFFGPVHPRAIVQNSSGAIRVAVKDDPWAIGYVSLGVLELGGVKPLTIGEFTPTEARYPYRRPLTFVTRTPVTVDTKLFLAFVQTAEAQAMIKSEGLIPAPRGGS